MTQQTHDAPGVTTGRRETTSGWLMFGGTILVLAGLFNVVLGVVGLVKSTYYVMGPQGLLVFDLTAWSWIHLIVGLFAAGTGAALFFEATWARVVAVLLAGFNALAQLVFLSANPLWCTIIIALDILVIWAVLAHGNTEP
ncbi:hypothetical protein FPZ12_008785 [Amycolatopsis acidicola]|uniref:DUF7144 domain-containing protein n=1 Tax=Amycolatopsis acidicola TaxID=2596893 RepID=A0A5N0VB61_9PSEU|nr:hypothetical protein [Amycolatopsis acidicola]KAA9163596.1 hypothetical protein FPZ12_008785 [Amycolatopsis acidicola]